MKYLLGLMFVVLAVIPFVTYLVYYYRRLDSRRKQLLQTLLTLSLHEEYMLMRYRDKYEDWKTECQRDKKDPIKEFENKYFNEDFRAGHSHQDFIWPVLLFTIFEVIGWLLIWDRLFPLTGSSALGIKLPDGLMFGFLGAYFACLFNIFGGFRREDLVPADYYSATFQILFSSFAAYVVTRFLGPTLQPIGAFGFALFPVPQIWTFLTERAAQAVGAGNDEKEIGLDLAKIQGLEHSKVRQKLLDIDISTVQGLATADPLLVFFRTNFPMRTVLDMVDKAILYLYLEDDVVTLRKHGINGIIELVALARLADKKTAYENQQEAMQERLLPIFESLNPETLLEQIARVIGQTPEELKAFIYNMYYDPVVRLIYEIWGRYLNRPVESALIRPPAEDTGKRPVELPAQPGVGLSPATWAAASGLAKWVGTQVAGAVVGKIAGELFSKVMDAIGMGGPDLVGKLDKINDQLVEVQRSLDRLTEMTAEILKQFDVLKEFMVKSLEITILRAAITRINVAYRGGPAGESGFREGSGEPPPSLRELVEKMPHYDGITPERLQQAAKDFAAHVSDMPGCIASIHDALAVEAFEQLSLVMYWARELAEHVKSKKIDREAAYLVLEGYFLQAVSEQLKAVSVHCVALGTDPLGPQRIRTYLQDNLAKIMANQTAAFVEAVELLIFSTSNPGMTAGMGDGFGEREFPKDVDEILLRADLVAAALNLVGHKPDSAGKLSPSIQAAIQGIYGRALLRPSDLNNGVAPALAPKGYNAAAGGAVRTLAFPCLDLVETAGRPVLKDASTSAVTVAHYYWPFPSPEPAVGTPIDPSLRGGVTPARYPVFGKDEPLVLAAGLFDVSRLYRGLPSGAQKKYDYSKFPGGYNDIGYYEERCSPRRHALVNDREDAFETFFNVVNIWRANIVQHSYVKHPLFEYSGGRVKVRLTAFVASRVQREPRKDGQGGTAFGQRYEIINYLKLRQPNGSEKQLYDSVLSFGNERPLSLNLGGGGWSYWHERYECRRDGFFSIDFDLEPGSYELVLDSVVSFSEGPKRYEGWQSSSLAFFLHGLSIERV